jgi:hypothetical protein
MQYPNDERTLMYAIYRDDMIAQLMHGDEIKTTASNNNVWKYEETIPLNSITCWKGKKVFDYYETLEEPVLSKAEMSSDNKYVRYDLFYGATSKTNDFFTNYHVDSKKTDGIKFMQISAPTDALKRFFHMPIDINRKSYGLYYLLDEGKYDFEELLAVKELTTDKLKHGKDGDGNVFLPHVGFNAYVDFALKFNEPSNIIASRPFILKARVYLKSLLGTETEEDVKKLALSTMHFYVKDVVASLTKLFGNAYYIP